MSHRSARWIALAFTSILIVLFGAVLVSSLPGETAEAQAPAATFVATDVQQESGATAIWTEDERDDVDEEWQEDEDDDEWDEHEEEHDDDD